MGNFDKALEKLEDSLVKRKNFSKAKREKVQVLINLERFEEALSVAKENYENDKNNPYHIHAYFLCLIKTDDIQSYKDVIDELIENLGKITSDFGKELKARCDALYAIYIDKDLELALALIDKAIEESNYPIYALQDKFDICEHSRSFADMEVVIDQMAQLKMRDSHGKDRALYRIKVLYAALKKDNGEVERLLTEIDSKGIRINLEILKRKVEKITAA